MKMKAIIILCVVCLVLLCACSSISEVKSEHSDETGESMFVCLEETLHWKIVYHRDTKVMYAVSDGTKSNGVFTLLVNPDGTPMVYKGED